MISFITAFKDFTGSDRMAQRSALWSWHYNGIPMYCPDDELSVRSNCADFDNVTILEDVKTARSLKFENDSPLVNDLILKGLEQIKNPIVALINGDIIIRRDFAERAGKVFTKYGNDVFLTGTRFNLDLGYEINSDETYDRFHEEKVSIHNTFNSADIFITSTEIFKKMAEEMPPLVMGRYGWDNWIHFWVVANDISHYNCTHSLLTVHCQHDHTHIEKQEGKPGRKALSSVHNLTHLRNMQNVYGNTVRISNWQAAEI